MKLIFNELSFQPHLDDEYALKERLLDLHKLFQYANSNHGFDHIVFPDNIGSIKVTNEKTFLIWAYDIAHQGDKNKILSLIKRPYTADVLQGEVNELSGYYYENAEIGIPQTYCYGLATAYVKQELCSSLRTHAVWEQRRIAFKKIINIDFDTIDVSVTNVSCPNDFMEADIKVFIENLGELNLLETQISADQKPINLREDHGKEILMAFAKRIRRSKYVLSIINSLPFNPTAVNLIRKVYSDGKIEMVLYWEDKGIGLVIQTTGRNYRETSAIAEILRKEFDR